MQFWDETARFNNLLARLSILLAAAPAAPTPSYGPVDAKLMLMLDALAYPRDNSCQKQLVNIMTFEVATHVVGLVADLFSLCVQERSQTLTGQPGDHAHWVKRVSEAR